MSAHCYCKVDKSLSELWSQLSSFCSTMYQFVQMRQYSNSANIKNGFETSAIKVKTRFASFSDSKRATQNKHQNGYTVVSPCGFPYFPWFPRVGRGSHTTCSLHEYPPLLPPLRRLLSEK